MAGPLSWGFHAPGGGLLLGASPFPLLPKLLPMLWDEARWVGAPEGLSPHMHPAPTSVGPENPSGHSRRKCPQPSAVTSYASQPLACSRRSLSRGTAGDISSWPLTLVTS